KTYTKLNPKLKSYLTILIFLIIGMLIMGIAQLFKTPDWLNSAFIVLALFVLVNIATAKIFNLNTEIKNFWSLRKIYFLPIGIIAGGIIAVSPILAGILTGSTTFSELKLDTTFTVTSIFVTLAIVAWEELWFRGIFLNYCNRHLSAINISITIWLLFILVILLNPDIIIFIISPSLFFVASCFTIVL